MGLGLVRAYQGHRGAWGGLVQSDISEVLNTEIERRDWAWELRFFDAFARTDVDVFEEPQQGPDGFPYLVCSTEKGASRTERSVDVIKWASERGVGIVLNPQKEGYPDYVFPYGMLWYFVQKGYFVQPQAQVQSHGEVMASDQITHGQPTEEYLPSQVRKILKEFFLQQNILNPRIALIFEPQEKIWDLHFSRQSLGLPESENPEDILTAISWFLPQHYTLAVSNEVVGVFKPL